MDSSKGINHRGTYQIKQKIPRQTAHSRKKRLDTYNLGSNADEEEASISQTVVDHAGNCFEDSYSELQSAIPFLDAENGLADTPTRCSSTESAPENETAEVIIRPQPLFEGSYLQLQRATIV